MSRRNGSIALGISAAATLFMAWVGAGGLFLAAFALTLFIFAVSVLERTP